MKKIVLPLMAIALFYFNSSFAQGKFSGYMFGDYYYNIARDASFYTTPPSNSASSSAAPGAKTMQAFQIRRVYFAYDNAISDQFSTRFRLEVDQAANASNGKISVFVKDAYFKWKDILK